MKGKKLLINASRLLAISMLFSVLGAAFAQVPVTLVTTATLTALGDGSYQATVYVSNNGTSTAQNVVFSTASLGSAVGTPAPQAAGDIPSGGVASMVFTFPASAGASGAAVVERYGGSYSGGTFGGSVRAVLPPTPALIAQLNALITQAQALEAGNTQFPLQVSNTSDGSDVNKAFPWVYAAEFQGLNNALQSAQNALIQWNTQAITSLQNAITTFTGEI